MARVLRAGERLLVASHNPGKVVEIEALLAPYGVTTIGAAALGLPEPEETGVTFEENAALKARAAAEASGLAAIADDSGLVVPALGGAPGIYSARWAGPDKDFRPAMARVQRELGEKDRRAHFVAVLALAWPANDHGGQEVMFRGEAHGRLVWPPRGERGFGYDPMFVPDGYNDTFGEMGPGLKHKISHRARAFAKLAAACLAKSYVPMTQVYLLWHVHELAGGEDDEKLIGVYATEADAMGAIDRLRDKPGFKDFPEDFQIVKYIVNEDNWIEGFISAADALKQQ